MKKFYTWFRYNTMLAVVGLVFVVLIILFAGCTPKTNSLLHEGLMVNSTELQAELIEVQSNYDMLLKKAEVAQADLAAQYAFREKMVNLVGSLVTSATTGTLTGGTMAAAGGSLLGLLAIFGLFADNRKKDGVIETQKKALIK